MGNNQSNHFPHIPGKITWYGTRLSTVNHRPFLSDFFLGEGRSVHRLGFALFIGNIHLNSSSQLLFHSLVEKDTNVAYFLPIKQNKNVNKRSQTMPFDRVLKFEHDQSTKTQKSHKNLFQPKARKQNSHFIACVQTSFTRRVKNHVQLNKNHFFQ